LTAKTYTEALLKDESAPHGHSTAYIRSLPLRLRPTQRLFWKTRKRSLWSLYSL